MPSRLASQVIESSVSGHGSVAQAEAEASRSACSRSERADGELGHGDDAGVGPVDLRQRVDGAGLSARERSEKVWT